MAVGGSMSLVVACSSDHSVILQCLAAEHGDVYIGAELVKPDLQQST